MPVHEVEGGWQWGEHGTIYHGPGAREKAEAQGEAAHANGFSDAAALPKDETELSIARQIASGELSSPQPLVNGQLFDLRITGTGTAWRPASGEFVYRPPENFLTDEFVQRCSGLPVIFEHPEGPLDTDEFRDRIVGTIIYPYLSKDEVRGIARIMDEDAAILMGTTHASTSPAVVFTQPQNKVEIDGDSITIEGKPALLDHLAICTSGVWDKSGLSSNGINNGVNDMVDETKVEKKGAEVETKKEEIPAWAADMHTKLDGLHTRLDALEKAGEEEKENEPAPAMDAAEADKKKAEEARIEADSADRKAMAKRIEELDSQLKMMMKTPSHEDRDELGKVQARADSIMQLFSERAPMPMYGERSIEYRKRLADKLKKHSKQFSSVALDSIEGPTFDIVENTIYQDAQGVALSQNQSSSGRLIPITEKDAAGRTITKFLGDIMSPEFMGAFDSPPVRIAFNKQPAKER